MKLVTGYLSSRQMKERLKGCQASGIATGRAARQISKIGVHREGHAGMGLAKILSAAFQYVRGRTGPSAEGFQAAGMPWPSRQSKHRRWPWLWRAAMLTKYLSQIK